MTRARAARPGVVRPRAVRLIFVAALAGASAAPWASGLVVVVQRGRAFDAEAISIRAGDTVRFSNQDTFGHQVYAEGDGFSFRSDEHAPGTELDVRFPKAGTFDVLCEIHPRMRLRVDVK